MQTWDDNALLREYLTRNSDEAFAMLVSRHVNMVYSVALRLTRNPHAAEEITQAVFVILVKKARQLGPRVILSGWLYQTARLTALTSIRANIRRGRREQEAHLQILLNEPEPEVWRQIAPFLDDAMARLNAGDRHAVMLRYFDGKSMKEVGTALGASEDAAKMRVSRAVEKLRRHFTKRGVTVSAGILTAVISANSVQAAPVALAKSVSALALAKSAAGASTVTLVKAAMELMAWSKVKSAVIAGAVVLLAVGTGFLLIGAAHSSWLGGDPDISGAWEGRMTIGEPGVTSGELGSTRVVLKFVKTNGVYAATSDWIDLGRKDVQLGAITYHYPSLSIVRSPQDIWSLKVNADGKQMLLDHYINFTVPYPVLLTRTATPDAVPEPLKEADFQTRPGSDLQGYWEGKAGTGLNAEPMNLKIAGLPDGTFRAETDIPGRGIAGRPVIVTYNRPKVELRAASGSGLFQGTLNADNSEIRGVLIQGGQSIPAFAKRIDYQAKHAHDADRDYSFTSDGDLQGHWLGAWDFANVKVWLALDIAKLPDGSYYTTLVSIYEFDNDAPMPATSFEFQPPDLRLKWKWAEVAYVGRLQNGKLVGTWLQGGGGFPLTFERRR